MTTPVVTDNITVTLYGLGNYTWLRCVIFKGSLCMVPTYGWVGMCNSLIKKNVR